MHIIIDFFTWVSEEDISFFFGIFFQILSWGCDLLITPFMREDPSPKDIEEVRFFMLSSVFLKIVSLISLILKYVDKIFWNRAEFTHLNGFLTVLFTVSLVASVIRYGREDIKVRREDDEGLAEDSVEDSTKESTAISSVDAELTYLLRKHEQVSSELTPRKYRSFVGYRRESSGYSSDITKYLKKRQTSRTVSSANSKKRSKARVWTPEMQAEINRKLEELH